MIAITETPTTEANTVLPTHFQTIDEFEAWERQPPLKGSYEFVSGQIIPKPAIKQNEADIADFLLRQFIQTPQFAQKHTLLPELDAYVDLTRRRRPDLTYFSEEQRQAIRRGEKVKTLFAIEILSDSETYDDILDKLEDYFDGGAQLVWYIIPKRQKIFVYTSPDDSKTYKGQDVISASPVVPELQFILADMFA
ncbi:Uma2 family endonuclease [Spirosoma arcticum]